MPARGQHRRPGRRTGRCAGGSAGTRALLVGFVLLTALATNQLYVLSAHTDKYFAWTISRR